jgi:hypothetical protein
LLALFNRLAGDELADGIPIAVEDQNGQGTGLSQRDGDSNLLVE